MNSLRVHIPGSPVDDTGGTYFYAVHLMIGDALDGAGINAKKFDGSLGWLEYDTNDLKCALDVIITVLKEEVEGERPGSTIRVIGDGVSRLSSETPFVGEYRLGDGKWH